MQRIAFITMTLLFTSSCSLFREKHCNPQAAMSLGKQDANVWDSKMRNYNKGESCDYDDYVKANYRSDYMNAYNLTIKENCKSTNIMGIAKKDALGGYSNFPNLEKLGLCSKAGVSFSKVKSTYMKSFKGNFCKSSTAKKIAKRDSKNQRAMNTEQFKKVCGSSKYSKIYKRKYLGAFNGVVSEQAKQDAIHDRPRKTEFIDELIKSKKYKKKFREAYLKSFDKEILIYLKKLIPIKASQHAADYNLQNSDFIDNSQANSEQKNELRKVYERKYNAAIMSVCTVNKVMTMAKDDARADRGIEGGMGKIQNCPEESNQSSLTSSYVKNFNQEKEKIRLEKERKRLQAEKRRLEEEKRKLEEDKKRLAKENEELKQNSIESEKKKQSL